MLQKAKLINKRVSVIFSRYEWDQGDLTINDSIIVAISSVKHSSGFLGKKVDVDYYLLKLPKIYIFKIEKYSKTIKSDHLIIRHHFKGDSIIDILSYPKDSILIQIYLPLNEISSYHSWSVNKKDIYYLTRGELRIC